MYMMNDVGNAERLLAAHPDDMCWVVGKGTGRFRVSEGRGGWWIWDGTQWNPDMVMKTEQWAFEISADIIAEADGMPASRERDKLMAFGVASGNMGRVRAMLNCAKPYRTIARENFVVGEKITF